jgi:hypothetical protein
MSRRNSRPLSIQQEFGVGQTVTNGLPCQKLRYSLTVGFEPVRAGSTEKQHCLGEPAEVWPTLQKEASLVMALFPERRNENEVSNLVARGEWYTRGTFDQIEKESEENAD